MIKTNIILALSILFAIFATLAGAGGGCFGRGKSSVSKTHPSTSLVYTPSAVNTNTTTGEKRRYSF